MKALSRFAFVCLTASTLALGGAAMAAPKTTGGAAMAAPKTAGGAAMAAPKTAGGAAMTAPKMADDAQSPVAKPLSAWLVGPSMASQFDAKDHPDQLGCLMVAEFDNGMIVGVHARAAGIVGMTVDTRQATLQKGAPQTVGLNLGSDAYALPAVASDASTLSVSFDKAGGGRRVSERLVGLGNFRLLINQKPYYFATTGFTDGLARLQECMGGTMAVTLPVTGTPSVANVKYDNIETKKVTSSGNQTPLALAMPELVPSGYRFVLDNVDPMTPVSWQSGDDWTDVMRRALEPHNLKMTVRDDVVRISLRSGTQDPIVDDAQTAGAQDGQSVDEVRAVPPQNIYDDAQGAGSAEGVWVGAKGENLADVLEAWGLMAGIKVKTDLQGQLVLPQAVRFEGPFDHAVQDLLAMFDGRNRPVGRYRGTSVASALSSPAPVAVMQQETRAADAPSWSPKSPSELRDMAKKAQEKWGVPASQELAGKISQMAVIPDPANAPKTVSAASKAKSGKAVGQSWQALEGTSLRDVLEHWGRDAGVKVLWLSGQTMPLPETFNKTGKFEDALGAMLELYKGQGVRPLVQLNTDPATHTRVLIVKSTAQPQKG